MEPQLQHDPRTKQQIKDALYEYLYIPVQRNFRQRLEQLIEQNTILGGYNHRSFLHKGVLYNCDTATPPRKSNKLVPQLQPAMADYLKELKELNEREVPYVLGFINQVLNASNDFHDYLRLLPESMHPPLLKMQATCPCQARHLSDAQVNALREKNQASIALMKQRMVTNLLI